MTKVIGLTGGIATGKSTVSRLLEDYNFYIVDADVASRKAVEKGSEGLQQVKDTFGEQAILNGEMNRPYIGSIVFNDEQMREKLNQIIHPIVRNIMEEEKNIGLSNNQNVIMDIPLLFENKLEDTVDETWLVYTTEEIQKQRLMKRNNLSETEAMSRIKSQLSIEDKKLRADEIIDNNKSLDDLKKTLKTFLESKGF
ncbi:dephospho-CoA kinase [Mammaliicoccus sp. Dog046]|uniref:dephospho-CoA kinase n=1 Tax=Mammaliicoccus sp. Dog046 TaxID=3034233 RepID=UPI002B262A67|nr:dephospho-CoA kinase [Mammaliicoccus sp. Dog046]WQK86472.1 dephospho-CoA kinase [Mammaliicoccus sp. Dog046]